MRSRGRVHGRVGCGPAAAGCRPPREPTCLEGTCALLLGAQQGASILPPAAVHVRAHARLQVATPPTAQPQAAPPRGSRLVTAHRPVVVMVPLAAMATAAATLALATAGMVSTSTAGGGGDAASAHDFTRFEDHVLPKWLQRFTVDQSAGLFSYDPQPAGPACLYGSNDVIHVMGTVGMLHNLTDPLRDAWAAQINTYQTVTGGFYVPTGHDSQYHEMGEATATLHGAVAAVPSAQQLRV
jgi:hypothetical protein